MSDIPIYPIEDKQGNPVTTRVYENGAFHNNGNPVGCITEEDAVAQKFDTNVAFAKGAYCMQNHKMQKFKAAKSAGAWDSTKVDETTVGNELTQINNTLTTTKTVTFTPNTTQTNYTIDTMLIKRYGNVVSINFIIQVNTASSLLRVGNIPSDDAPSDNIGQMFMIDGVSPSSALDVIVRPNGNMYIKYGVNGGLYFGVITYIK